MNIEDEVVQKLTEAKETIDKSKKNPSKRIGGLIVGGWVMVSLLFFNVYSKTKYVAKLEEVVDGFFYKTE